MNALDHRVFRFVILIVALFYFSQVLAQGDKAGGREFEVTINTKLQRAYETMKKNFETRRAIPLQYLRNFNKLELKEIEKAFVILSSRKEFSDLTVAQQRLLNRVYERYILRLFAHTIFKGAYPIPEEDYKFITNLSKYIHGGIEDASPPSGVKTVVFPPPLPRQEALLMAAEMQAARDEARAAEEMLNKRKPLYPEMRQDLQKYVDLEKDLTKARDAADAKKASKIIEKIKDLRPVVRDIIKIMSRVR